MEFNTFKFFWKSQVKKDTVDEVISEIDREIYFLTLKKLPMADSWNARKILEQIDHLRAQRDKLKAKYNKKEQSVESVSEAAVSDAKKEDLTHTHQKSQVQKDYPMDSDKQNHYENLKNMVLKWQQQGKSEKDILKLVSDFRTYNDVKRQIINVFGFHLVKSYNIFSVEQRSDKMYYVIENVMGRKNIVNSFRTKQEADNLAEELNQKSAVWFDRRKKISKAIGAFLKEQHNIVFSHRQRDGSVIRGFYTPENEKFYAEIIGYYDGGQGLLWSKYFNTSKDAINGVLSAGQSFKKEADPAKKRSMESELEELERFYYDYVESGNDRAAERVQREIMRLKERISKKQKISKAITSYMKQNNPWAICTASVGRENKEKYESCVMGLKEKFGMEKEMTEEDYEKEVNISFAGPVPESGLAEQDLEDSTEKAVVPKLNDRVTIESMPGIWYVVEVHSDGTFTVERNKVGSGDFEHVQEADISSVNGTVRKSFLDWKCPFCGYEERVNSVYNEKICPKCDKSSRIIGKSSDDLVWVVEVSSKGGKKETYRFDNKYAAQIFVDRMKKEGLGTKMDYVKKDTGRDRVVRTSDYKGYKIREFSSVFGSYFTSDLDTPTQYNSMAEVKASIDKFLEMYDKKNTSLLSQKTQKSTSEMDEANRLVTKKKAVVVIMDNITNQMEKLKSQGLEDAKNMIAYKELKRSLDANKNRHDGLCEELNRLKAKGVYPSFSEKSQIQKERKFALIGDKLTYKGKKVKVVDRREEAGKWVLTTETDDGEKIIDFAEEFDGTKTTKMQKTVPEDFLNEEINDEQMGHKKYHDMAGQVSDSDERDTLNSMAEDEIHHAQLLDDMKEGTTSTEEVGKEVGAKVKIQHGKDWIVVEIIKEYVDGSVDIRYPNGDIVRVEGNRIRKSLKDRFSDFWKTL